MWPIRRATAADVAALAALCRAAVGPDDYVPAFLEAFLRTGVILLAEEGGRVVGMVVYHDVPDGSAWLHAARTHPDHRRRGVATALMAECETLSRQRGRSSMRLWANADNLASVHANRKYGFRERARFTRMRLDVRGGPGADVLEPLGAAEAWPLVAGSPLVRKGGGYVFHDFYFLPVVRATVRALASEGALWGFREHVVSVSPDFEDPRHEGLQIQVLAGDPSSILRAIPAFARGRGAIRVESFLPHDPAVLRSARRAGYALMDWGQEAVLFEKRLRGRAASAGTGSPRDGAPARRGASGRRRARTRSR